MPEVAAPAMPAALRPLPSAPLPCALCPFIYVGHAALTEGCLLPALRLSCDNRARRAPLGSLLGSSSSSSSRAAPAPLLLCCVRLARCETLCHLLHEAASRVPHSSVCASAQASVCPAVSSLSSLSLSLSLSLSRVCQLELCVL